MTKPAGTCEYDILIVGGGTAGTIAAVQAGRAGAQTLLVEKNGMLGGTMTVGGVNYPGLFHADGQQVIRGIGWELVTHSLALSGGTLPDFSGQRRPFGRGNGHSAYQVRVNIAAYAAVAEQAVLAAGVDLRLHTMLAALAWHPGKACWNAALCTKTGLRDVRARGVIDCTGDANAASIGGLATRGEREVQPATLVARAGGYDADAIDRAALKAAFAAAVEAGELQAADGGMNGTGLSFVVSYGGNSIHIHGIDSSTSEGKTKLEIAGRACLARLLAFYRRQPGLENMVVEHTSVETGVRESRCIIAEQRITVDDYQSGRLWDDAVCYSYYPIDLHTDQGLDKRYLAPGTRPTIPLGAMLPKGAPCFLAPGRHIDGDRLAHSAFRVQASCMAMGQAAGAAAALAARDGRDPREVPLTELRGVLREHDAIVPPTAESNGGYRVLTRNVRDFQDIPGVDTVAI